MSPIPAPPIDAVVVGGGPAGLACAVKLRELGFRAVVLEREPEAGGVPRHCDHQGFGLRDLRRSLSGPDYARRHVDRAAAAGAELRTETMVTGVGEDGSLELTSPRGRERLAARAVVLATGCRERPRAARLIAGSRPEGVMTTGMLQRLVQLGGCSPGRRALVVGAEHVSFSALATLREAGCSIAAMTTELERHSSLAAFRLGARLAYRVPLRTCTRVVAIRGRERVEGVELERAGGSERELIACDTVVFTADWIPDHELAVAAGLELDQLTRGPAADESLRASRPGWFAAGNLLRGAETADVAALEGRHAATGVAAFLLGLRWPERRIPVRCEAPLGWISPNLIAAAKPRAAPPRARFALRAGESLRGVVITVAQDGSVLWRGRLRRVGPGRSARLAPDWVAAVDPGGGEVVIAPAGG